MVLFRGSPSLPVVGLQSYVSVPPRAMARLGGAVCSQAKPRFGTCGHVGTVYLRGLRFFAGSGRSGFSGPYFFLHLLAWVTTWLGQVFN